MIGAGISGLVAARLLQRAGRSVQVYEGRARIGGRAYSPTLAGHPLDLGATWVWDSERAIHALLQGLNHPTYPHHNEGWSVIQTDAGVQRASLPISAVPERRIEGGVQSITQALANTVSDVALNTPVRAIEPAQHGVRVTTDEGSVVAQHVVAALPPMLLARSVAVTGIDAKRMELWRHTPVWMADVAKVVAVFPRRFWVEMGSSGRAASNQGPMVEVHDLSGPDGTPAALFGFVPRQWGEASDLEERVVEQFTHLFGPRMPAPVAVYVQRWWEEAMTWPGGTNPNDNHRLFGHPLLREPAMGGRLHLVSAETSQMSPGHLDGAVERATAVATQLR